MAEHTVWVQAEAGVQVGGDSLEMLPAKSNSLVEAGVQVGGDIPEQPLPVEIVKPVEIRSPVKKERKEIVQQNTTVLPADPTPIQDDQVNTASCCSLLQDAA